jgi:BirA family biotin operon repressor/biotin-[acetyl-CoA-carboxylase] ligase
VTLRLPSGERRGTFAGLDPRGRLELRTEAGLELIDAGDLYFPDLHTTTAELSSGPKGS